MACQRCLSIFGVNSNKDGGGGGAAALVDGWQRLMKCVCEQPLYRPEARRRGGGGGVVLGAAAAAQTRLSNWAWLSFLFEWPQWEQLMSARRAFVAAATHCTSFLPYCCGLRSLRKAALQHHCKPEEVVHHPTSTRRRRGEATILAVAATYGS